MDPIRRFAGVIIGLLPVPGPLSDERRPVDPRVDPDALEAFGEGQLAQFGVGQGHMGGAPLPTHYALEDAEAARRELERQATIAGSAVDGGPGDSEEDIEREACP